MADPVCWKSKFESVDLPFFYSIVKAFNEMTLERFLFNFAIPRLYLLGSSYHTFCFYTQNKLCTKHVVNLEFSRTELAIH